MADPNTTTPPAKAGQISAERVKQALQSRFNPIAGLTPERLAQALQEYRVGNLGVARMWDAIKDRWPILKSVSMKREKSAARLDWDVLIREEIDDTQKTEAELQRDVLKDFYSRIRATSVLDQDRKGGVAELLRQMMSAVGHKHSVHEIIWSARRDGSLKAEFRHCPLWFFESTTGKLRYMPQEYSLEGRPLEPDKWLVTCGDGLMEASSVAYVYRDLPLKDWLALSEKFGIPYLHGQTTATQGSAEWNAAADALAGVTSEGAALTSPDFTIKPIEVSVNGQTVSAPLVDKMDRYATILWRGGDLSTQSSGPDKTGASLQGEETDILLEDDAAMLSETLQEQVDLFVLRHHFGPDVEPLAYFRVATRKKANVDTDIKVDTFLRTLGIPMGVEAILERYGRTLPAPDDEIVAQPARSPGQAQPPGETDQRVIEDAANTGTVLDALSNEADSALVREGLKEVAEALAQRLGPLRAELERIAALQDPEAQRREMAMLRTRLPDLMPIRRGGPADPVQEAFTKLLGTGMVDGFSP